MEDRGRMLDYYNSGRFECDLGFYLNLDRMLKELDVYEWEEVLQKEVGVVRQIVELTEVNSRSLEDDYDDEEGVCQTYKIRKLIQSLNPKYIKMMIGECLSLNWQSYSDKMTHFLTNRPLYDPIVQRIKKTIHSKQLGIDSVIFLGLFSYVNGDNPQPFIQTYLSTVDHYLEFLSSHKKLFDTMTQTEPYCNLHSLTKIQVLVSLLLCVLRCCLRFCQILKVLTGKNNLSLKFTVIKKQIDKASKAHPQWGLPEQRTQLFSALNAFKMHIKDPSRFQLNPKVICKWCFKRLGSNQLEQHSFCQRMIGGRQQFKPYS